LDERKVALGDKLFHDPILSHDGKTACVTCHPLERGGADNAPRSPTVGGMTAVNTPTVFNVGFSFRYNWNGAFDSLEGELDAPLEKALGTSAAEVLEKLRASADYRDAFHRVYPEG